MHSLLQRLIEHRPAVTDGAWGTELQARGLSPGESPDSWNLFHADRVADVARQYVQAGSDVILTNTFGANRLRLAHFGLQDQVREINRRGVEISRSVTDSRAVVFASLGPSGKMLVTGETTIDELRRAFDEQASELASAGADALVVETMSDLDEAKVAVTSARNTGLPVVACMAFQVGKSGLPRTVMGTSPEQAARKLADAGADVIGANCGEGIAGFLPVCRALRAATELPLWIKANAGIPEWIEGRIVYRMTPEEFGKHVPSLLAAGARFIGGCCGTNPEFIARLKEAVLSSAGETSA